MESAVQKIRSGETRLGLSATGAAAVLYGAVVLLGLGPASPAAVGSNDDLSTPVVHVQHDSVVSGPVQRLPQVSAGPARHHGRPAHRIGGISASLPATQLLQSSVPAETTGPPSSPQQSEAAPTAPQPTSLPSTPEPTPVVTVPVVEVPLPRPSVPQPEALLPSPPTPPSVSLP